MGDRHIGGHAGVGRQVECLTEGGQEEVGRSFDMAAVEPHALDTQFAGDVAILAQ